MTSTDATYVLIHSAVASQQLVGQPFRAMNDWIIDQPLDRSALAALARCVHSCRSQCAESVRRGGVGAQCGCLSGYRLYKLPVVTSDMPKVNI